MDKNRDRLEFQGVVIEANKGKFLVEIAENYTALCTLSGKIRQSSIKILIGDRVHVEVSPYEPTKGRITYRLKN